MRSSTPIIIEARSGRSVAMKAQYLGHVVFYVDADAAIWRKNPNAVLSPIKPLRL